MRTLALCAFLALASGQTVPALDLKKYVGRWYQVYSDVSTEVFESRFCNTADYGFNPNGTVSVLNRERVGSIQGKEKQIEGYAELPDSSQPGKLVVTLQTSVVGPPMSAPYWVYELGPATFKGSMYEYSIVSDNLKTTLFVLARNVTDFKARFDSHVLQTLKNLKFNKFYDRPLVTYQEGCKYWDN